MATTDTSPNPSEGTKSWELPDYQYDEFTQEMQRWGDMLSIDDPEPLPEVINCYSIKPKAAFHFHSFGRTIARWQGEQEPSDVLKYLREEEPKILLHMKKLMLSMETDFENGRFLGRTCSMEIKGLRRAIFGISERPSSSKDYATAPTGLVNQLKGIAFHLEEKPRSSRWDELFASVSNLLGNMCDTLEGLESLLQQHEAIDRLANAQAEEIAPVSDGKPENDQGGLRRRRPDTQNQNPQPKAESQSPTREPTDHTPIEAMFLLTKAINVAFRQIPFADLRDALWKDQRAPTSLSLIFTSISSILIGVAVATHNHYSNRYSDGRGIDDGFFALLSSTITQLFSLYILLLPLLRGQEPHMRGLWFCLTIGLSVVLSVISCIVYAFSWHASAVLEFGGTLASMIAALLLVQGIDKGATAKESEPVNGDV